MRPLPPPMRAKMLAAADLFADQGLDATKMEDVAAATGVPKATLYYYFEGKEDILSFLFAEILDEVTDAIAGAVDKEGDAATRLAAAIEAHLRVFERFPTASRALQFDLGRVGVDAADRRTGEERIRAACPRPACRGRKRREPQPTWRPLAGGHGNIGSDHNHRDQLLDDQAET